MNILVTGSNGFIGRYFREFKQLEANFVFGSTTGGDGLLTFAPLYFNVDDVLKDMEIDAIIHLASVIPRSFEEASYNQVFLPNVTMLNNLFTFSVSRGVKKFIYISSFGSMRRPADLDVKDFYTASKITGEFFCTMLAEKGVQAAALRISAPYGEYSTAKSVINIFIQKALKHEDIPVYGSGRREQNLTYAGDVIRAVELCFANDIRGTYSIVSERNTSMSELAQTVVELTRSRSRIVIGAGVDPQEDYRPFYSYEKARSELGYVPRYNIRQGISRNVNWLTNG